MIWSVMILTMILGVVPQWWSEWGFRFWVIVSLGANVILGLLIGTRRRLASGGWRAKGQMVLVLFLWSLYQLVEIRESLDERHQRPNALRLRCVGGREAAGRALGTVPPAAPWRPGQLDRLCYIWRTTISLHAHGLRWLGIF
ncbi:unnamed protein product [Urochloa humidicola]